MIEISQETIQQAARGNEAAFDTIYHATAGFVYNTALRVTRDRELAREISQEVYVTLFDKLKTFRHESRLTTWLYRVTVNKAINLMKSESRMRRADVDLDHAAAHVAPEAGAREEQEQRQRVIDRLLDLLTPEQRACVVLRNLEGLSYARIAGVLGVGVDVVRSRLRRAREKFLSARREVMRDAVS